MDGEPTTATVRQWLSEPLTTDVRQAIARIARCDDVWHIAVMPDVHLAEFSCVGLTVATTRLIYPDAVGGDIGCGMAAVGLDVRADALRKESTAMALLDALRRLVPTNRRREEDIVAFPETLAPGMLSQPSLQKLAERDGRVQLGTLGRRNHFLEFQADEENRLWIMVHSGSRALGPAIRLVHLAKASRTGSLLSLAADRPEGQAYLADAEWACCYAQANRRAIVDSALRAAGAILKAHAVEGTLTECCHNHVRHEVHLGRECLVHRKGAAQAQDGQAGIIPGSMGSASFHVQGRGDPQSLASSSHGAGRRLSRGASRATISVRDLHRQIGNVWFDVQLSRDLREEAPRAYRDIQKVMRAQADLVRIVRKLRPVLSYKGV